MVTCGVVSVIVAGDSCEGKTKQMSMIICYI